MFKPIIAIFFCLLFSPVCFGQIKEIIDKDLKLIKYVPYDKYPFKEHRKNKKYRLKNPEYHEILALDTIAIPYLIKAISDTTQTAIRIPCATHELKIGDIAFALLNDIIGIPWYLVTGEQGDSSYSCEGLPDGGWDDLYLNRQKIQQQVKLFFDSKKGKIRIKLIKGKNSKEERENLLVELLR